MTYQKPKDICYGYAQQRKAEVAMLISDKKRLLEKGNPLTIIKDLAHQKNIQI